MSENLPKLIKDFTRFKFYKDFKRNHASYSNNDFFGVLKERNFQPRYLCLMKMSSKNEVKIKSFLSADLH